MQLDSWTSSFEETQLYTLSEYVTFILSDSPSIGSTIWFCIITHSMSVAQQQEEMVISLLLPMLCFLITPRMMRARGLHNASLQSLSIYLSAICDASERTAAKTHRHYKVMEASSAVAIRGNHCIPLSCPHPGMLQRLSLKIDVRNLKTFHSI